MTSFDELLREADPERGNTAPDPAEIEAALAAILRRAELEPRRCKQPRRRWAPVALAASLAGTAAVAVLLVNVLPGDTPGSVRSAWAKQVIAKATTAARGTRGSVLYADVTMTIRQPLARISYQREHIDYWQLGQRQQMSARRVVPPGSPLIESVIDGRLVDGYNQRTNVIEASRLARGGSLTDNPLGMALEAVPAPGVGLLSGDLREAIVRLMHARGVRVTRTRLDGTAAIALSSHRAGSFELYLRPKSYAPLEFRRSTPIAGRPPHTTNETLTFRFNAYKTARPSQLPANLFNLRRQHPMAKIVPGP